MKLRLIFIFSLLVNFSFGQSNDCATATVVDLSTGNACETGTTVNATSDNILYGACNTASVNEVWYTYVSNGSDNQFTITPQGMTNAEIVIYTGSCGGQLESCTAQTGTNVVNDAVGLTPGTQVWVGVMSNVGTEGSFELCISSTAPAPTGGNLCSTALPVCDPATVLNVDMSSLGPSGANPGCFGTPPQNDVFIEFTVLQSGTFEWEATPVGVSVGVELDWAMYDITGGCGGTEIDCNYNYDGAGGGANGASSNPPGGPSGDEYNAPLTVVAGNTYAILVDYYTGGATGTMDFAITGGTAIIAPVADFTISPTTVQCATTVDITITDNSIGVPSWDFGNGNTYTGNNPPVQTYPASGTYAITATINGTCTSTMTEFVQVFGPLASVPAFTDETCIGDCDGDASVAISGGSGTYDYFWSPNGETTTSISGLCSGNFSVTVSDAICGTSVTEAITIGGTNCATCLLTNLTANISACNPVDDSYTTNGVVEFTDPPLTGTLTVSDCNGVQQVFNAPFTSPINYNLIGQTADGTACDITAVFSADVTCTQTVTYTAPICLCNMDNFFASIGSCDGILNTFQVTGDMAFTSPPSSGTLVVEVDNGTTIYDTIINLPFVSPQTWSISGIPADGSAITITTYFSADPGCTSTLNSTAPADCSCSADVGTFTTNSNVLCFGEQVDITSNLDGTPPGEATNPPGPTYDPGVIYLAYTCPPSVFPPDDLWDGNGDPVDPCLIGVVSFGNDYSDPNTTGTPPNYGQAYTNNTIYYVPITGYSLVDGVYSYTNTSVACYDMGAPISVQYLPQVISTPTEDCFAGTVSVVVSGGLPAVDGSLFTGSNLLPGTASFTNATAGDGGTILVSGLQDGDNYSFDITDGNGCPVTISGTFTGVPVANAGTDNTSCTLSYNLSPVVSFGTGTWTGPGGATFSPNANTANATVTVPAEGSYTFTWTEDNGGGCLTTDDVVINFSNLSQTFVENCPSTVTSTVQGGYTGTSGFNTASNLLPGTAFFVNTTAANGATITIDGLANGDMYSFDITDDNGCIITVTGGPFVGTPVAQAGADDVSCTLNYTLNATASFGTGIWTSSAGVSFAPNNTTANAVATFPSEGSYTFTWTEDNGVGCSSSDDVVINFSNLSQSFVEDCQAATVTATIQGGYTGTSGVVTASNLLPATASFGNTTTANGGDIVVNGLLNGDMYSFDVADDNGCIVTVSGGPFVGVPIANAGADDGVCVLTYTMAPTPSYGTGTWTGTGVTFTPNANTPTATVTVTTPGTYTMTWTEDNGNGCVSTDDVIIQFSNLSFIDAVVQSTCGNPDGEITLTASNGIAPYQYSLDGGTTFPNTTGVFTGLLAGNYNVAVQDALGCIVTGTVNVADQGAPVINSVTPSDVLCNAACDGTIAINASGATLFSVDGGGTFQAVNSFTNLCAGNYNIVVENAIGCQATSTTIINEPAAVSYTVALTDLSCFQQCDGIIDITATGGSGTLQYSIDNGVSYSLNNVLNNLCAGTYDVIVQDLNNCQASSVEVLTEPAAMTLTLGITNPICNSSCDGEINSIPAGGDGNYTYSWSNGLSAPLISNLCSGPYTLSVEDGKGCTIDTTVTLVGPAAAVITNVIEVDESCPGMCDGSLEIVASNVTQYSIDGVNFQASPLFSNLCAGNFTVYAQDVNACSTTSTALIESPTAVNATAVTTSPICIDGTALLDGEATGGTQPYTFSWADNTGNVLFNTEDANVSPAVDASYTLTVSDLNGCTSSANVLVQVSDSLSLTVIGDNPICIGSTSNLFATVGPQGGNGGPYTFTWDQGLGVGAAQTVSPTQSTVYTVTITDGCETPPVSAQVTVNVNTVPNISFTGDQLSGCAPVTTNFIDNLVPAGSSCLWEFGDGGVSTQCGSPAYTFTEPGCWDVTLTITTQEGCVGMVTIPNYVCVFAYPVADFEFGPQPTTVMDPIINFDNTSYNASSYNWIFDTGGAADVSQDVNPTYTFPADSGSYEVCLTAITDEGCTDDTCHNVLISEEFIVYVPNAFSPDGDLINNIFTPVVIGVDPFQYSFMIFNRWGELIFESSHPSIGWDGYYKGLLSQTDVYVWKLSCVDASTSKKHEYIGHVTLLK